MGTHKGKRLTLDIEVSPAIYWLWKGGYGINVPTSNLLEEAKIICVSYKWEDERRIRHLQWDRNQCDKKMLQTLIPILQEAGTLIGHNSDGFDLRWIRTRCLYHRIPCPPDFVTVDTWKLAKKHLRLQGNGLKYIAKFLKLKKGKIEQKENAQLWQEVVFQKSKKALKEMVAYCDRDVEVTAKVYDALVPYVGTVGHRGGSMQDCPHCGSSNTRWEKDRVTQKGGKHTQFRCQEFGTCGKYSTVASTKWYNNKNI